MAQDANKGMSTSRTSGASTTSLSSPSDTAHLRQQIADTRAGMTSTIDAIQDRVSPRSVIKRTLASIKANTIDRMPELPALRNFAGGAGSAAGYVAARTAPARARAMRATREHPTRTAIVGAASAAAVWMAIRSFRNGRRRDYLYDHAL